MGYAFISPAILVEERKTKWREDQHCSIFQTSTPTPRDARGSFQPFEMEHRNGSTGHGHLRLKKEEEKKPFHHWA